MVQWFLDHTNEKQNSYLIHKIDIDKLISGDYNFPAIKNKKSRRRLNV